MRCPTCSQESETNAPADAEVHGRSIQKLSKALVVIHVSTLATVVVFAIVYVCMLNGWTETAIALSRENAAANCQVETLQGSLAESKAEVAGLKDLNEKKDDQLARKDDELGKKEVELRKISSERDEARLAALSPTLNDRESRTANSGLVAILARAKSHNVRPELAAHKSEIEALRRKVLRGENRPEIVKDYNRLIPKLDQQTQEQMQEMVGRPLMGE